MASPSPSPPWVRVIELSACQKRSKMRGKNSLEIPLPVSATVMATCESRRSTVTSTLPPRGVNLMAFVKRFHATCWRRSASPWISPESGSRCRASAMPLFFAAGRTPSIAAASTAWRSTGFSSTRSFPEVMRETSRMSSMSCVCACALRSMVSSARPSDEGSTAPVRSIRVQPRMALSGVRSSCETVARNSSLVRLAASACVRAAFSRSSSSAFARSATFCCSMSVALAMKPTIARSSSRSGTTRQRCQR